MEVKIIAKIHNQYKTKFGIPRQSGLVNSVTSKIVFEPEFRDSNAFRGIEEYSHLWLIWQFSENEGKLWSPTVRPPRLGGNKRMGVFATRSPFRPNGLGLSVVELIRLEMTEEGPVLYVKGADLMDGTPILDIKPYLPHVESIPEAKAGFAGDVAEANVEVEIAERIREALPEDILGEICEILSQNPKPGYQKDEERIYGMEYGEYEIKFRYYDGKIRLLDVKVKNEEICNGTSINQRRY